MAVVEKQTTIIIGVDILLENRNTIVRAINMFQNAQWQKPIFQELKSRVLFEIETRGQVFCIALGQ